MSDCCSYAPEILRDLALELEERGFDWGCTAQPPEQPAKRPFPLHRSLEHTQGRRHRRSDELPRQMAWLPKGSHRDDVDLYHRRTRGHAADRTFGRLQGRHLGAKATLPCRVCYPTHRCGALYPFRRQLWLIGVQLLDGVGAGIFGALAPLVIADIMRGTDRYNLAQGVIATVQG